MNEDLSLHSRRYALKMRQVNNQRIICLLHHELLIIQMVRNVIQHFQEKVYTLQISGAFMLCLVVKLRDLRCILEYSQKEDDTSVGHGVGQSQNPTTHDSIAKVEDRHSK